MTDDFTTKEMLIQLMARVESLNISMQEQRILLEKHIEASLSRDEKIKEIKDDLDTGLASLDVRVGKLEKFQIKAMLVWSIGVTAIGFLLNKFLG